MSCPSCAAQLPAEARFCPSCGQAITSAQGEERRIVTVLFADLVGFTGMAEHLDPEQVKRYVEGAFALLSEDVTAFGGSVDKFLGDGILALFGAPVAHEDDAERAVRAALRMQRTLADYVAGSALEGPVRMRVGINTGEVLVGTLAGIDYTAMGDVVNTASRIQAEAPPGGVLVGESTHALTAAVVRYEEAVEIHPRGREFPVMTWLARDVTAPPGRRQRRSDLSLVGRDAELALCGAAIRLAFTERRNLLINVVGESGVGKTRFVDELLETVVGVPDAPVLLLEGTCAPYGESNVWWPIASALAAQLGLDPGMAADEVRAEADRKATQMFPDGEGDDADRMIEVFAHLLGYPSALDGKDPAARRDIVHRAVAEVIERRCEKCPIVLSIDDLHWADQVVVDLLEHLVASLGRLPFVVVTATRPDTESVWPPHSDRTTIVSLSLPPLGRAQSDLLAGELLGDVAGGGGPDPRLLAALFERSGGNPLFLQELAGVVSQGGSASNLPDSLRALIAARLDQLGPAERQVLDNAAILGVSGTVAGLERFAAELHQVFDASAVVQLDAKGFLEVDGRRWRFRSDSVREAAYQTLTKTSRAQRHAGTASFLSKAFPNALDDLAHHTATAAELVAELGPVDMVPPTIRADAVRHLTAAAERARETGSQRLGVRHATRAIALLGDVSATGNPSLVDLSTRLHLLRAQALVEQRDFGAARSDLDRVLAAANGKAEVEGEARLLLGSMHHLEGDRVDAREELGRSVDLLRSAGNPLLLAGALRQRGFIELFGGSLVDAEWFFGEAEGVYRTLGDERGLAYVEQYRAWLSFLSGDLDEADRRLHHAAETLRRLGDRNGVGWAFGLLSFVRFFQRRFDEAEDLAVLVRSEATERGDDWAAAMMQSLIADLRLWQGQLEEALASAEQARARFRKLEDKFGLIQSLSPLIRAQVALGRTTAVQRTAEELMALAEGSPLGPVPLLAVAGAAMHRGDAARALLVADQAIVEFQTTNGGAFEAHVIRAIALAQLGRVDDALAELDEVGGAQVDHPFSLVASSLVHWSSGDLDAVIHDAAELAAADGATYLDRAIAAVAAAGAHAATGALAEGLATLDRALAEVLEIGDVVAIALLQQAYGRVAGVEHPSGAGDRAALGDGWQYLVSTLPAMEPVA